jgi:magnesium transporter
MPADSTRAATVLSRGFLQRYPEEAARVLDAVPVPEVVRILEGNSARALAVLERLTPDMGAAILEQLGDVTVPHLVTGLDPARAALLLARLDEDARARILGLVPAASARELKALMAYPPESAGALMDPRVPTFSPDTTAGGALGRLRARGRAADDVFLVDGEGRLAGVVALEEMALARPAASLRTLVRGAPRSVQALAARDEVVEHLTAHRQRSLPVVDFDGRLLGAIGHDILVRTVQEEASADVQTMVGASKEERALSRTSFAVRKRLPWLQINLATAFLAAAVVGLFESTIARFTALAVLLPVVAGQSGNTGAQALAVTMRGLALREIRVRHWPRVAMKELNVSLINGLAVALTTALGVYVWSRSVGLALVIGISMVISMAIAGLAGASVPVVLSALGQDPAQSSSIILTTITDVVGFLSFLGIATLLSAML